MGLTLDMSYSYSFVVIKYQISLKEVVCITLPVDRIFLKYVEVVAAEHAW